MDLRWQAAAGTDAGAAAFHPTALVGMRNRLRASVRLRRLFEDTKVVATAAGAMKNRARVLDPTPVYDAVATQDTVTQLRAAVRKVLAALDQAGSPVAGPVRQVLHRDHDYAGPGKPPCDWDDPAAREALVDELVTDALGALDGQSLPPSAAAAADVLALVAGQDVEEGDDGVFRIARKTARDRVISTVDVQARHGHKSRHRRFGGYKSHLSVDPDSKLIVPVPGIALDMAVALDCLADFKIPQYVAVSATAPPRNPGGKLLERRLRTDTGRAAAARAVWPAGIPAGPPTGYLAVNLPLPPAGWRVLMSGAARPPGGA